MDVVMDFLRNCGAGAYDDAVTVDCLLFTSLHLGADRVDFNCGLDVAWGERSLRSEA